VLDGGLVSPAELPASDRHQPRAESQAAAPTSAATSPGPGPLRSNLAAEQRQTQAVGSTENVKWLEPGDRRSGTRISVEPVATIGQHAGTIAAETTIRSPWQPSVSRGSRLEREAHLGADLQPENLSDQKYPAPIPTAR
jgi:hypothetical protein